MTQQFRKKLFACEEKWVFKDLYALEKRKIQTTYKDNLGYTKWKLKDLSVTQILCEIIFGESRSIKSAILTHLEALNFDFYEFLHFLKDEIYQII